ASPHTLTQPHHEVNVPAHVRTTQWWRWRRIKRGDAGEKARVLCKYLLVQQDRRSPPVSNFCRGRGRRKEGDLDAALKLTSQVWTYLERCYVRRLMLARVQGQFEAAAVVRSLSLRGSNRQSQLSITDLQGLVGFFSETRLLCAHTHYTSP
ncbi:hypothetical protein CRENBAI_015615, partial [Crenichthys baileyi]